MKKIILSSTLILSLFGAFASSPVAANDRQTGTKEVNGQTYNILNSELTSPTNGNVLVGIQGEFLTPDKQAILSRINAIRKEAFEEGLVKNYVPIKWSTGLEKVAFVRAAESSVTMNHARLSDKEIWSASTSRNDEFFSENLAWNYNGFMGAIDQWYEEKADYVKIKNGQKPSGETGHYESLINPAYTYVGLAAFNNPKNQWITIAQNFGTTTSASEELAGGYGRAIQFTEATPSKVQSFTSKAVLVNKDLKPWGTETSAENNNRPSNGKHIIRIVVKPGNGQNEEEPKSEANVQYLPGSEEARKAKQAELAKNNLVIAKQKVAETEEKVRKQKEEDLRNYPTNTNKTVELEIAEVQLVLAKAELELLNQENQTNPDAKKLVEAKERIKEATMELKKLETADARKQNSEDVGTTSEKEAGIVTKPQYYSSYIPTYTASTFYSAPKAEEKPKVTTGWKQENGVWYFYKEDGTMATGWIQTGGKWYYLGNDGMMQTGWAKVNGSWYYLNPNGAMATGWVKDGDTWYYLGVTGSMATGWLKDGDTWYYLEASGAMKANQWFKVSDKWYYVNGSGALAVNTTVDGYRVNENGEWV